MKYIYGVLLTLLVVGANAQDELKRPDIPGHLMIDIGLNYWDETAGALNQKGWPSKSFSIYYARVKKLNNSFTLNYGLGFSWEKVGFEVNVDADPTLSDAITIQLDTLGRTFFAPTVATSSRANFDRYKIGMLYLDIPLELRWYPKKTQDGEGLFLSAGGIVGLRLKSFDKSVVRLNGDKIKDKTVADYGLNNIRYGAQVRFGWNGVHLFYKRYFSNVFKDPITVAESIDPDGTLNGDIMNPTMTTIGINITGF